jgi:hypothetical protein
MGFHVESVHSILLLSLKVFSSPLGQRLLAWVGTLVSCCCPRLLANALPLNVSRAPSKVQLTFIVVLLLSDSLCQEAGHCRRPFRHSSNTPPTVRLIEG